MRFVRGLVVTGWILGVLDGCDCAKPISGTEQPPPPPVVTSSATQCGATFVLEGTKAPSTSITIDGQEVVAFDEKASWRALVTVADGISQTFVVTAVDGAGRASTPVTFTATVSSVPPAPPTLDPLPSVTETSPLTVTGSKPAGTAIWAQGTEIVPASPDATFSVSLTLAMGNNLLSFVASDGCLDSAPVEVSVFFRAVVQVTGTAVDALGQRPAVAAFPASPGVFVIAWHNDAADNNDDIFMRIMRPTGFDAQLEVSSTEVSLDGPSRNVSVGVDASGAAHFVWQDQGSFDGDALSDFDILYRRWTETGFDAVLLLSDGEATQDLPSQNPNLVIDPSDGMTVHVVWDQKVPASTQFDVVYRSLTGITWTPLESVTTDPLTDILPRVAVDQDGGVHVVWMCKDVDAAGTVDNDICYAERLLGGGWTARQLVDDLGDANDTSPVIAADLGNPNHLVHLAWVDGDDIYWRTHDDGAFGQRVWLSDRSEDTQALSPTLAVDADGNAAVAWPYLVNAASGTSRDFDVFVRRLTPSLQAYAPVSDPLDAEILPSTLPALAFDPEQRLLIVWQQETEPDQLNPPKPSVLAVVQP